MKLYGLAAAFLHDKDDPAKLHIHCNPISIVDERREHFEIVKDLAYKETVDLTDIGGSCRAFTRFIDTWEAVIERQNAGLAEERKKTGSQKYKHLDLPLAVMAGDADFNRINLNALFTALTGRRYTDKESPSQSRMEHDQYMQMLELLADRYAATSDEDLDRKLTGDPDAKRCSILKDKIEKREGSEALINKVTEARKLYLEKHHTYPAEFIEACGKLPGLLEQSFYHRGKYSNTGKPVYGPPPNYTKEIASLERPFRAGSRRAFKRLMEIAAELGAHYGWEFTGGSKVFKLSSPKGFADDPALQKQHPELAFFHWRDAKGNTPFKDAFHEAFLEANWHPSYRHIGLPMGGNNPFYTDPVADMVMELFQIARGARAEFSIKETHDDPLYRPDHQHKRMVGWVAKMVYQDGVEKDRVTRGGDTGQASAHLG